MKLLRILLLVLLTICTTDKAAHAQTTLDKKQSTIVVTYAYIGCPSAQWAINDRRMHTPEREHIFLEPANDKLPNADNMVDGSHIIKIKITGRFYNEKGYPKKYHPTKGNPAPARVFRYYKIVDISPPQ
ncbi:hypothetical protein EWM62_02920 [Mucilaginibacter terrigena]|uniref:DUF4377 domain-containing protein n=1 Tax=Mucilaginibacter terrigena TaxID=2492395 RepID=A0A4Q5LSC6_9SPHI|nr:hypothetical protein [Mucilaginibacter terrigena]RYU92404.1 hypothetical protein EWM62_02920 [Mucilaginibacter terrigena]